MLTCFELQFTNLYHVSGVFFSIKNFSYFVLRTKYRTGYRCAPGYHSNSEGSCSYGMYIHLVSFTYYNMPVFVSKKKKERTCKWTQDQTSISK